MWFKTQHFNPVVFKLTGHGQDDWAENKRSLQEDKCKRQNIFILLVLFDCLFIYQERLLGPFYFHIEPLSDDLNFMSDVFFVDIKNGKELTNLLVMACHCIAEHELTIILYSCRFHQRMAIFGVFCLTHFCKTSAC